SSGVALRLLPAGMEDLGAGGEVAIAAVATDGTFTFASVPAGAYIILGKRTITEFAYAGGGSTAMLPASPAFAGNGTSINDLTFTGTTGISRVEKSASGAD